MNSVMPIKRYSWLSKTLVLVLLAALCSGCIVKRYKPELKLIDAHIEAPEKKYLLALRSETEKKSSSSSDTKYIGIRKKIDDLYFLISVLGEKNGVSIVYGDEKKEIIFLEGKAFYQLNSGEKEILDFNVFHRKSHGKYTSHASRVELFSPGPLSSYKLSFMQGGLTPLSIKTIKEGKRNKHRIYIPFTVDGKPYAVDITFKVKLHGDYYVEVPGTP